MWPHSNECKFNHLIQKLLFYSTINFKSQITAWSEYSTMNNSNNLNGDQVSNDLADWFVENKIIEYLFGPNLHVEVTSSLIYLLS